MDYASRKDVEAAIKEWTAAVLACRLRGHRWPDEAKKIQAEVVPGGYNLTEWCERQCGVHRWYFMNRRGLVPERPHPIYPSEGYLLKGMGRVDADGMAAIRLAVVIGGRQLRAVK